MLGDILEAIQGLYRPRLIHVSAQKIIYAEDTYEAEDVVSETESNGVGTAWLFENVVRRPGGAGIIIDAQVLAETTNIGGWFDLQLYTQPPTCELDDDDANTGPIAADRDIFVTRVSFPACSDMGTGFQDAVAVPGGVGGLPKSFICAPGSRHLWGVMVIRNAVDLADDTWLKAILAIEQY